MTLLVARIRILPAEADSDLEEVVRRLKSTTPNGIQMMAHAKEPIAFGLVSLKVMFIVDDGEGGTEIVEEKLAQISGVSSVEVLDVRRLM